MSHGEPGGIHAHDVYRPGSRPRQRARRGRGLERESQVAGEIAAGTRGERGQGDSPAGLGSGGEVAADRLVPCAVAAEGEDAARPALEGVFDEGDAVAAPLAGQDFEGAERGFDGGAGGRPTTSRAAVAGGGV